MFIDVNEIKVRPERGSYDDAEVLKLSESIAAVGLINPITVDKENYLIAGLHRLEAIKRLGWTEIACNVIDLAGKQAELAEIDENIMRREMSVIEKADMLLRRKEIYETIHPETRHGGDRRSQKIKFAKCELDSAESFADDTAKAIGVHPSTVLRFVQIAKSLTPEAKEVLNGSETKITQDAILRLMRFPPEQQTELAVRYAAGEITSIPEYTDNEVTQVDTDLSPVDSISGDNQHSNDKTATADAQAEPEMYVTAPEGTDTAEAEGVMEQEDSEEPEEPAYEPFQIVRPRYSSVQEAIDVLKDPNRDLTCKPETFLDEVMCFARKFEREIQWFDDVYYAEAIEQLERPHLDFLHEQIDYICSAARKFYRAIERKAKNELPKKTLPAEAEKADSA